MARMATTQFRAKPEAPKEPDPSLNEDTFRTFVVSRADGGYKLTVWRAGDVYKEFPIDLPDIVLGQIQQACYEWMYGYGGA